MAYFDYDPLEYGLGAMSAGDVPRVQDYISQIAGGSPAAAANAQAVLNEISGAVGTAGGSFFAGEYSPPAEFQNIVNAALPIPIGAAGVGGIAGALTKYLPGALKALGIGGTAGTIATGAAGLYGILQGLGLGEGGGLFGLNLLGGDDFVLGGVPFGGPGLAEPPSRMVLKEWQANGSQFYQLTNGKIAVYSRSKRRWKVYRPQKLAVIGKKMPSHRMVTRLRRNLKRHSADARTILQITSPKSLRAARRHYGYRRHK